MSAAAAISITQSARLRLLRVRFLSGTAAVIKVILFVVRNETVFFLLKGCSYVIGQNRHPLLLKFLFSLSPATSSFSCKVADDSGAPARVSESIAHPFQSRQLPVTASSTPLPPLFLLRVRSSAGDDEDAGGQECGGDEGGDRGLEDVDN